MTLYTNHARARMQQRGFTEELIQAILDFGKEYFRKGSIVYLADKGCIKELIKMGYSKYFCEKCKGRYVVVSHTGDILTVAHKHKHFAR
ncbi:DUF4258 domain-containing protein [Shewanella phaeophyticola]|uniref:DUF4258 domain-containing protein n=1 Tax=Shewanella phaeophyticola TaxID=2978345 RepID=A0ABT2P6M1_9GAMM|nr:DUF4258 domain-containing protein [Shewanella sp. KJ10-1]MCT8988307.1 DUF4258 domain-containing protein [Shewanella sp. KJ10-1]